VGSISLFTARNRNAIKMTFDRAVVPVEESGLKFDHYYLTTRPLTFSLHSHTSIKSLIACDNDVEYTIALVF
jgi:hypothetical protein